MNCCLGRNKEQKSEEQSKEKNNSSFEQELSLSDRTRKSKAILKRNSIQKVRTGGNNFKETVKDNMSSMGRSVTHYAQQIGHRLHRGQGHNNIGNTSQKDKANSEAEHPTDNSEMRIPDKVDFENLTQSSKRILKQDVKSQEQKAVKNHSLEKKVEQTN